MADVVIKSGPIEKRGTVIVLENLMLKEDSEGHPVISNPVNEGPTGSGPASSMPVCGEISFHAVGFGDWELVGVPSELTDLGTSHHQWFETSGFNLARIIAYVKTAASSGTQLVAQYSADEGATWSYLDGSSGPTLNISATGPQRSGWATLAGGARTDVIYRMCTYGGDGTTTPVLGKVAIQFFSEAVNPGGGGGGTETPLVAPLAWHRADRFDAGQAITAWEDTFEGYADTGELMGMYAQNSLEVAWALDAGGPAISGSKAAKMTVLAPVATGSTHIITRPVTGLVPGAIYQMEYNIYAIGGNPPFPEGQWHHVVTSNPVVADENGEATAGVGMTVLDGGDMEVGTTWWFDDLRLTTSAAANTIWVDLTGNENHLHPLTSTLPTDGEQCNGITTLHWEQMVWRWPDTMLPGKQALEGFIVLKPKGELSGQTYIYHNFTSSVNIPELDGAQVQGGGSFKRIDEAGNPDNFMGVAQSTLRVTSGYCDVIDHSSENRMAGVVINGVTLPADYTYEALVQWPALDPIGENFFGFLLRFDDADGQGPGELVTGYDVHFTGEGRCTMLIPTQGLYGAPFGPNPEPPSVLIDSTRVAVDLTQYADFAAMLADGWVVSGDDDNIFTFSLDTTKTLSGKSLKATVTGTPSFVPTEGAPYEVLLTKTFQLSPDHIYTLWANEFAVGTNISYGGAADQWLDHKPWDTRTFPADGSGSVTLELPFWITTDAYTAPVERYMDKIELRTGAVKPMQIYKVRVVVAGNVISTYIDDVHLWTYTDNTGRVSPSSGGKVGFEIWDTDDQLNTSPRILSLRVFDGEQSTTGLWRLGSESAPPTVFKDQIIENFGSNTAYDAGAL